MVTSRSRRALFALVVVCCFSAPAQWQDVHGNLPIWGVGSAIAACDSLVAVVAIGTGPPHTIYLTTDGGHFWSNRSIPYYWGAVDVSLMDSSHIWATTDSGAIYGSTDGGRSWVLQFSDTTKTVFMNYVKMFDIQNGIAMGDGNSSLLPAIFLRTFDGGKHWVSVNDSAFGAWSGDVWRRLDFPSPTVGYFYESGFTPQKMYRTSDGCAHWKALGFPDSLYVMALRFADEETGLVFGAVWRNVNNSLIQFNYVARTGDGGTSWEVFPSPATGWGNSFGFSPGNPARAWMTDNLKLYFSADTGRTWTQQLSFGGRDIAFTDLYHGWMLGDNGTLYYTATGGQGPAASVTVRSPNTVAGFALSQNYPNPFNPTTTIRVELPRASQVNLSVCDVLGREVCVLINERRDAGVYEVRFDGSNLASGVYFYRLTAGDNAASKKMIVVR